MPGKKAFPKCLLNANFTETNCSILSKAKFILSVNTCPPFHPLPAASGRKGSGIVSVEAINEVDGKIKMIGACLSSSWDLFQL